MTTILCSMKQIIKYYADKNLNGVEEEINFKDRENKFHISNSIKHSFKTTILINNINYRS